MGGGSSSVIGCSSFVGVAGCDGPDEGDFGVFLRLALRVGRPGRFGSASDGISKLDSDFSLAGDSVEENSGMSVYRIAISPEVTNVGCIGGDIGLVLRFRVARRLSSDKGLCVKKSMALMRAATVPTGWVRASR